MDTYAQDTSGSGPTTTGDAWERRFRAPRHTLPAWAKQNAERCVFVSNLTGVSEVYAWDREDGSIRQVTRRPQGTAHCAIESSGAWVWWFDDDEGDEFGVWMRQPFAGGPDAPACPGLGAAWDAGLVMGTKGWAAIGRSTVDDGTFVHVVDPMGNATLVYNHEEPAYVVDLSRDLTLVAVEHSEHGDSRHRALRILRLDGSTVGDIQGDEGGVEAVGFSPRTGDARLLLLHQRLGRWSPSLFDPSTGQEAQLDVALPGDVQVDWYPDGEAILVRHEYHARTELFRLELDGMRLTPLDVPPGTVEDARARPDRSVWYLWSNAGSGTRFLSTDGSPLATLGTGRAPDSVPATDAWVEGPGGPIHVLVRRPTRSSAPFPTVFLVHGGPDEHDTDRYDPDAAAWVDHGFAVVQVNYRGSTGYGTAWNEAVGNRVGLVELEDIAAAREWAVDLGLADPRRLVLAGASWGGYLALLGLGTQPAAWAVGLAELPIADFVAAYEDEMEEVKAMDRALFGGSPSDVGARYEASSPITYVSAVRSPVLISAGVNDPRCPIRQVENYVARLAERGAVHHFYRSGSGHGAAVVDDRVELFRRQLDFVRSHLP